MAAMPLTSCILKSSECGKPSKARQQGGPVSATFGIQCLTARNLVIMLRNATSKMDKAPPIENQELRCHFQLLAKIQKVPNADSGIDAKLLEQ
ncbi:hypothetical protein Tco_0530760, partial [Tanacetum coccineum]